VHITDGRQIGSYGAEQVMVRACPRVKAMAASVPNRANRVLLRLTALSGFYLFVRLLRIGAFFGDFS
jgi:hypothetical protein